VLIDEQLVRAGGAVAVRVVLLLEFRGLLDRLALAPDRSPRARSARQEFVSIK
jgi:hypothetical protein